ncbi:hypothetical protein NXW18_00045 [Bacteroides thetaiotaomicron]|uniref:hypothetical protein n=1 Tax=Bacteroides thetaiotaomicron TaxID=818 RepID=UPI0021650D53|nr:hypothetical protein [Bacteroides thetaiotaomicron]MCS2872159.1 hypothetical protein [Bacteroides thetaiotaomicron]
MGDTNLVQSLCHIVRRAPAYAYQPPARECRISRPDTGHIVEKQIIKITDGEGQFYTSFFLLLPSHPAIMKYVHFHLRWMLGFDEQTYFSRTFPVYLASKGEKPERSITTYQLNPSMRTSGKEREIHPSLFSEGGQL